MKIGCITTSKIPSNTANSIQAMKVCHALKEIGHDIKLWVPNYKKSDWETLSKIYGLSHPLDIEWLNFNPFLKQYDFSFKAVKESINWGANIIYTWALQSAVFSQLRNKFTVMEFHDFPMGSFGPKLFDIYKKKQKNTLTLTTTSALASGLEHRYQFSFERNSLQIAPNGTDPERYATLPNPSEARKKLGLKDKITAGFTGHFYKGRGVDLLLEIALRNPEIEFLWVGGSEEYVNPWRVKLKKQGVKNVTITGFIPNQELPMYQAACDILLMPYGTKISGSSGGDISKVINPMKMFDYLATGRAIVASEIPVFHEILNEDTAVFCPPDNPTAWSDAIQSLAKNNTKRKTLSINARKIANEYSWKERAKRTLSLVKNAEKDQHEK